MRRRFFVFVAVVRCFLFWFVRNASCFRDVDGALRCISTLFFCWRRGASLLLFIVVEVFGVVLFFVAVVSCFVVLGCS